MRYCARAVDPLGSAAVILSSVQSVVSPSARMDHRFVFAARAADEDVTLTSKPTQLGMPLHARSHLSVKPESAPWTVWRVLVPPRSAKSPELFVLNVRCVWQ